MLEVVSVANQKNRPGNHTACDWCITQKKRCAPTESESRKRVGVRGAKGPGMGKGKEKEKSTRMSGRDGDAGLREMVKGLVEEMREMKELMKKMSDEIEDIYQEVDGEYQVELESESGSETEEYEDEDEDELKREWYEERTGLGEEKKEWARWGLARVRAGKPKEVAPKSWYGKSEDKEEKEDEDEDDEEKNEVV